MTVDIAEWLNLALRWLHVSAGIAWIGSSFYFVWLDNHLKPPVIGEASGEVWSVHGGGFYHNQKYQVAPAQMPADLHWFKWEAYFTWLSGFSLLVLIYFVGAGTMLVDQSKATLTSTAAIGIALGALAGGWLVYDGLCRSPIGRNGLVFGAAWFVVLLGTAIGLDGLFNARGAYMLIGAMIGTAMVGNVFFVIIPKQRIVVADLVAGRVPDPALGKAAKQRSVHNNYMTLPVLFVMLSQHYPMTYGADRPWLVLALLSLTGVAVRHVFNLRHIGANTAPTMLVAGALALVSVTYVSTEKRMAQDDDIVDGAISVAGGTGTITGTGYAAVAPIFARHCSACHAVRPTEPGIQTAPLGVLLDTYDHASAVAPRIKKVAVDAEIMPLGNKSGMTKAERATIGTWISQGTPR